MQNEKIPSEEMKDAQHEMRKTTEEIGRLQESIERTMRTTRQASDEIKRHEQQIQSHRRSTNGLWAVTVLLIVALAGAAWYGYPELKAHARELAEVVGVKEMLTAADDRIGGLEEKTDGITADDGKLNQRLTSLEQLEKTVSARLGQVKSQTARVVSDAEQRIVAELNQRFNGLQSRVAGIEGAQQTDQARITDLQNDLARAREEMASLRQQTGDQVASLRRETSGNFADVSHRIGTTQADLDALSHRIGYFRVDFELGAHQSEELFSGIRMTVNDTNVGRQQVGGWLLLVKNGRTVWVQKHGIEEPLTFYTDDTDRPYQVVFTQVRDHSVLGYLLVPNQPKNNVTVADN